MNESVEEIEARIEAVAKEWTDALAAEQVIASRNASQDPAERLKQEIEYIKAQARTRRAGTARQKLLVDLGGPTQ